MVSLYEVLKDKYGLYYVSYNKKHRIKTLENKNKKVLNYIKELEAVFFEDDYIESIKNKYYINYKIIEINDKKYIQFG